MNSVSKTALIMLKVAGLWLVVSTIVTQFKHILLLQERLELEETMNAIRQSECLRRDQYQTQMSDALYSRVSSINEHQTRMRDLLEERVYVLSQTLEARIKSAAQEAALGVLHDYTQPTQEKASDTLQA